MLVNAADVVLGILGPSKRNERERPKSNLLIFLRGWKFEIEGKRDAIKLANNFSDRIRFFVQHKNAVESHLSGRKRSVFGDLAKEICDLAPDEVSATQNGEMTGRDTLSKAISAVIVFLERN